jgi:hypothetical protein
MFQNPANYLANPRAKRDSQIRVVVAEPNRPAEVRMIGRSLDAMQAIVGGYIEHVFWGKLDVYLNEEGRLTGHPPNRVVGGYDIVGTLFVSRSDAEGEQVSQSESEAEKIRVALDAAMPGGGGWKDPYIINPVGEIHPAALRAAKQDMRLAEREGEIAIGQTRVGTVFLRCDYDNYSITKAGPEAYVIAAGKKAVVLPVLAGLYAVTS